MRWLLQFFPGPKWTLFWGAKSSFSLVATLFSSASPQIIFSPTFATRRAYPKVSPIPFIQAVSAPGRPPSLAKGLMEPHNALEAV